LKEGDLVQASEKLWGAAALAVKRIAAKRGTKLERYLKSVPKHMLLTHVIAT
jgi:hypothetical protein